jgi:superfamily II DNA/RNA helicase
MLVIDEADLIFSFGYEEDLKTILKHLPEKGYQVCVTSTCLNFNSIAFTLWNIINGSIRFIIHHKFPFVADVSRYFEIITLAS